MRAIVVDDDRPTVDVIVNAVSWKKFQIDMVDTAYDMAEAQKILRDHPVDLVISDIEMPMGSGLDLLKWMRDSGISAQVIFLTNHERFDFAQTAIRYNASGYVVKPFQVSRMEQEIAAAVAKIRHEQEYRDGQKYEAWFTGNIAYVEHDFWEDLLQEHIAADREDIEAEIRRRRLSVDAGMEYRAVLVCASGSPDLEHAAEISQNAAEEEKISTAGGSAGGAVSGSRENALRSLTAQVLAGSAESSRTVSLHTGGEPCAVCILQKPENVIREEARQLIRGGADRLGLTLTVYIGNQTSVEKLSESLRHLRDLDRNNVASKGEVFSENDEIVLSMEDGHILNQEQIRLLLSEKKIKELLNLLKLSLQSLMAEKKLDAAALTKIRQELLQAVYVYLNSREIQAAQLFANAASEQLERRATESVMDMMRWQVYLITQTVNYVTGIEQSDSVVNRAKAFIREHYAENISRTEIAASMYLAPEYMARVFKKETGVSLKQYLSDYRIARARELLADPNESVSDAAGRVGFDNFSYFSTVFRKTVGMSPNEYRSAVLQTGKAEKDR